jgi:hypothetical protein
MGTCSRCSTSPPANSSSRFLEGTQQLAAVATYLTAEGAFTRRDVGAAFGAQLTQAGYHLNASQPAGTYQLVVFAYSSVAREFNNTIVVPLTVR